MISRILRKKESTCAFIHEIMGIAYIMIYDVYLVENSKEKALKIGMQFRFLSKSIICKSWLRRKAGSAALSTALFEYSNISSVKQFSVHDYSVRPIIPRYHNASYLYSL